MTKTGAGQTIPTSEPDAHLQFVMTEYRSLWTYYIRTLDERHKVIEYYFRSVTIPASLVGLLALFADESASVMLKVESVSLPKSIAAIFLIIFLVGASLYIYYVRETSNSKRYSAALGDIRSAMRARSDLLNKALTLSDHEIRTETIKSEMPLFRAGPMIFINSAIGAVAGLLYFGWSDTITFAAAIVLTIAHLSFWASAPKHTTRKPLEPSA